MINYTVTQEWTPVFRVSIAPNVFRNMSAKQIKNIVNDILGENGFKTRLNELVFSVLNANERIEEELTVNSYDIVGYIRTFNLTKK